LYPFNPSWASIEDPEITPRLLTLTPLCSVGGWRCACTAWYENIAAIASDSADAAMIVFIGFHDLYLPYLND
jgi:hypothetical protein